MRQVTRITLLSLFILLVLVWAVPQVEAGPLQQQPTVDVPTVTSTSPPAIVTAANGSDAVNVRSGPSTLYAQVGILIPAQQVPGLGRTPGGEWIQIAYPGAPGGVGWVYYTFVKVVGNLAIVDPPPTPTPQTTPTFDPTLAAEFQIAPTTTRLPTFTAPPPLEIPTFQSNPGGLIGSGVPMGYLIIALAVLGLFGLLISILGRR